MSPDASSDREAVEPDRRHEPAGDRVGSATRPLIDVDDLAGRLPEPGTSRRIRVVDVRWVLGEPGAGRAAYEAGHVPGAIFLDLDTDLSDPDGLGAPGRHPLPSPRAFADRLEAWGIGDEDLVVAYDDSGGWVAARLWWMLDNLGPTAAGRGGVVILDGGWAAWLGAGLPTSADTPARPAHRAHLAVPAAWSNVIERDELRRRLGSVILLDARAAARYRGEIEPIDPVPGHVPTAISAPWDRTIGPDGRFLTPGALRAGFAELGIEAGVEAEDAPREATAGDVAAGDVAAGRPADQRAVVVSCGSGTSAAQHVVAARLAGLPDPILYVGSYSDWSRSGLPVATGPEPGSPELARR